MTVWIGKVENDRVGNEEQWLNLVKSTRLEENSAESVAYVCIEVCT